MLGKVVAESAALASTAQYTLHTECRCNNELTNKIEREKKDEKEHLDFSPIFAMFCLFLSLSLAKCCCFCVLLQRNYGNTIYGISLCVRCVLLSPLLTNHHEPSANQTNNRRFSVVYVEYIEGSNAYTVSDASKFVSLG